MADKSKVQLAEEALLAKFKYVFGDDAGIAAIVAIEKMIFAVVEAGVEAASPGLLVPVEEFAFKKLEGFVESKTVDALKASLSASPASSATDPKTGQPYPVPQPPVSPA